MSLSNVIKRYVKEYFEISYYPKQKQIMLHDCNDIIHSSGNKYIDIGSASGVKVTLVWGKIEEITGVQYHHKKYQSEMSKFFFGFITEKKSKDFFKLLVKENIPVNFTLNEMIEQFPVLND